MRWSPCRSASPSPSLPARSRKAGLVTAIIGGFLISLLGGSRVQIGGPTGAFIVVVYGVIQQHGFDGLMLATLMAGVILVIGGLLRAGRFIALVPEPVIEGFTIGIALIIAVSQLKDLLGLSLGHGSADLIEVVPALWQARGSVNPFALGIGLFAIGGIAVLRRFAPWFPGSLLVIAVASAAVALLAWPVDTIQSQFGALPGGLPLPSLPHVSIDRISELLPSAFVIAFLAGVESLLSAIVADRMIGGTHRSECRTARAGRGEHRLALVRRASRHRGDRAHGDQRPRRRANAGRRYRSRADDPRCSRVRGAARGLSRDAGARGSARADGVDHERAGPVARAAEAPPRRPRLAVPDHDPDRREQPDRGHRGRDRPRPRASPGPP